MYKTSSKKNEGISFIKKYPLIFKKYRPLKFLSQGAFSEIYLGINIKTKEKVAIKVEQRNKVYKYLESESFYLFSLKGLGIPKVISYGHNKEYDILVMPLLGKSLHEIQMTKNFNFEFKDICLIAIQLIERLEWIHSQKIIHRDIKPDNFLIGLNDPNIIYVIDFGLSKKYRSSVTGNHIKYNKLKHFIGSLRYASVNSLKLREQSRRDDLESLGYMLIFLIKGTLPWDHIKIDNKRSSYLKMGLFKKNILPEILCQNLPYEFVDYINYVRNLNFEDEPNYDYLKSLFQIMLNKQGFEEKKIFFSWIDESNINKIKRSINLSKRASSSRGRIFKQIRNAMNNKRSKSEVHNTIGTSKFEDNNYSYNLNDNNPEINNDEYMRNLDNKFNQKNIKINYENKPIINNYIYSYISPTNHFNINNNQFQNHYQYDFHQYNPNILKKYQNNEDMNSNINYRNIYQQNRQKNYGIKYIPIISYNNIDNINNYQINKMIGNLQDITNINLNEQLKKEQYLNNYNIKPQSNKNFNKNNLLSISYKNVNELKNNNYMQSIINYKRIEPIKISKNINILNQEKEKHKGFSNFKKFNILNISPFKKKNNQTQIKQKSIDRIKTDNNIKNSNLLNEIKNFNRKFNIKKNDKKLMRNKMMKIKKNEILTTNQSADNGKFIYMKNRLKYLRNNADKNCQIF